MYPKTVLDKIVVVAPGRICLFGDHQDYLGLPVIACAIDRHIRLVAKRNHTMSLVINKPDIGEKRIIDLNAGIGRVAVGDHFLAAIKVLGMYGCSPDMGYDITISGNIAINAGTSSSSAVVTAWIRFLIEAYGCNITVTKEFISRIAHVAEVTFHDAPGGKMDQYSIGLGNIMYLETGKHTNYELFYEHLPGLIVAESGIPKDTTGVLGELKEKALLAIRQIKEKLPGFKISNASKADLPKLLNCVSDDLRVYLEAAVLNHDITRRALEEFRKPKWNVEYIGRLMTEHHNILKKYLGITLPQIDLMIDGAINAGALGAKIVGSGRGGSIVVLSRDGNQDKVIDVLLSAGAKDAYAVTVDQGARIIKSK